MFTMTEYTNSMYYYVRKKTTLICWHKRAKTLYNRTPEMNLICRIFWADLSSLPGGRGPDVSLKWSTTCRCVTASQGAGRIDVSSYGRASAIGDH